MFTIPIFDPLPPQYYVRVISDRWLHAEAVCAISFKHLILPEHHPPHTELLNLQPLSILTLRDEKLESLYSHKLTHFNPIQTQIFHTLYYSDSNVLLGKIYSPLGFLNLTLIHFITFFIKQLQH